MNKQSDESKILWMRDSLDRIVKFLNKNNPNAHLFTMITIKYDGEAWSGYVHPFVYTDTNRSHTDRIMMMRNYRTNTFGEIIDQMMDTVKFQDNAFGNYIKNGGEDNDH